MRRSFYGVVAILGVSSPELSLKEIQDAAVRNAPQIQMAIQNEKRMAEIEKQSRKWTNPSVTYQEGTLKTAGVQGRTMDITLMQPFAFPGKRQHGIEIQNLQHQISKIETQFTELEVQHAASIQALQYQILNELKKHSDERRRRYELVLNYFKTHPQASPTQKIESILIETQIQQIRRQLNALELAHSEAGKKLNLYLSPNQEPAELPRCKIPWITPDLNLEAFWKDDSPEFRHYPLEKLKLESKIHEQEYRLAKKSFLPDLSLGINYRIENVDPKNRFLSGVIGFQIPIWDQGQAQRQAARMQLDKNETLLSFENRKTMNEIENKKNQLRIYSQNIKNLSIHSLKDLEKKYQLAEKEFKMGRIPAALFVQADTQLHEMIDQTYLTQLEWFTALSELKRIQSKPMPSSFQ